MNKEEIKNFIDKNNQEEIINYIFELENELMKNQKGLELARVMIKDMVSKDRFNDIVKKYNEIIKKYNEIEKRLKYE